MISARRVEYRQGTPLVLVATKITKKNLAAACGVKKSQCGCCKLKINTYICTTKTGFRSLWHGESVAQQVEHNTFNVGVLGSSPSGFTKYPATDMLPDIFFAWGSHLRLPPRRNPEPKNGVKAVQAKVDRTVKRLSRLLLAACGRVFKSDLPLSPLLGGGFFFWVGSGVRWNT